MSINLYMMMDILENQHVHRRIKSSKSQSYNRYASGSEFIGQFQQKPAYIRRRHKERNRLFQGLSNLKHFPASGKASSKKRAGNGECEQNVQNSRRKSSGFSFPVPSLMTLAVIAGILVFSMAVLNWQGFGFSSPLSLNLNSDERTEQNLASYAGIPMLDAPVQYEDIPLDLMEVFEWKSHKVQRGESVYKISRDFGISMETIVASNNIKNAKRLAEGTVLRIPNMDGIPYTVKKGDSLSKISASMNVPLEVILDVNDVRTDVISAGQFLFIPGARMAPEEFKLALGEMFIYPIKGRLSDPFGWRIHPIHGVRSYHAAIDLAAPAGTPVKAAMDGKVSATGYNRILGNFIILDHSSGYQSLYAHLSAFAVKQGLNVIQGSKIGEVGSTGESTGPHLHFAIYKNKRPVNPLDLL